jgi:hypothetical protein
MRYRASFFNFQDSVVSLKAIQCLQTSSSLSSRYLYASFCHFFNNVFQKIVPTQDVTNAVSVPSFYCLYDIPLLDSMQYFLISHMIGPTDLLHPSPAPHYKTFQVFLIYFPKCPSFSTIQCYAANAAFQVQFAGEKSLPLAECCFCHAILELRWR